jgi:glutaredoxin
MSERAPCANPGAKPAANAANAANAATAAAAVAAGRARALATLVLIVLVAGAFGTWWWLRSQQRLGAEVARLAAAGDIRMIASQDCAICHVAREWFTRHGVAFSECLIERDAQCRADFEAVRAPGTPVIVVRGQPMLGFEPFRLRDALRAGLNDRSRAAAARRPGPFTSA